METDAKKISLSPSPSPLDQIRKLVEEQGPIRCVRVSSAQASGRAKQYSYWGAARYRIELTAAGDRVKLVAEERASSDRRSKDLAFRDALHIALAEDRVLLPLDSGLRVTNRLAEEILEELKEMEAAR